MSLPRLQISPTLRTHLAYPKCAAAQPRMLVLESQYWLDDACANAAAQLGWPVARVPVVMEGVLGREALARLFEALVDFRPDFVLSINLSGMDESGLLARFFEDAALPYVAWFVDNPRTILLGRSCYGGASSVAFSWERAYLPALAAAGFAHTAWLPLAADPAIFNAAPLAVPSAPPAFVGSSMVEFCVRERAWLAQHPPLLAVIDQAFAAGAITRDTFAAGIDAWLPAETLAVCDEHQRRHAELYAFIEGTRRERASLVATLTPLGLEVRGDNAWEPITGRPVAAINYREELPDYYRASAVQLNCTSLQMASAVNQRVFDVPAAGGLLLTDVQRDLAEIFAEDEVLTYRTLDEAAELMARCARDHAAREALIHRARARVLSQHTYVQRLQTLYARLQEWFLG